MKTFTFIRFIFHNPWWWHKEDFHSLMSSVFPENARILLIISQERVPMVREVMERKLK
jgi:hypothetical protein